MLQATDPSVVGLRSHDGLAEHVRNYCEPSKRLFLVLLSVDRCATAGALSIHLWNEQCVQRHYGFRHRLANQSQSDFHYGHFCWTQTIHLTCAFVVANWNTHVTATDGADDWQATKQVYVGSGDCMTSALGKCRSDAWCSCQDLTPDSCLCLCFSICVLRLFATVKKEKSGTVVDVQHREFKFKPA